MALYDSPMVPLWPTYSPPMTPLWYGPLMALYNHMMAPYGHLTATLPLYGLSLARMAPYSLLWLSCNHPMDPLWLP